MAKKIFVPEKGDVFAIKLDSTQYAFGQVVHPALVGLNIIFDIKSDHNPQMNEITNLPILFIAETSYVLIEKKQWVIIGNAELPEGLKYPEYISNSRKDGVLVPMVYGFDHGLIRTASDRDIQALQNHKSYTPNVIDDAVKARFGYLPWKEYYENLYYKY